MTYYRHHPEATSQQRTFSSNRPRTISTGGIAAAVAAGHPSRGPRPSLWEVSEFPWGMSGIQNNTNNNHRCDEEPSWLATTSNMRSFGDHSAGGGASGTTSSSSGGGGGHGSGDDGVPNAENSSHRYRDPQAPGHGGIYFERLETSWNTGRKVDYVPELHVATSSSVRGSLHQPLRTKLVTTSSSGRGLLHQALHPQRPSPKLVVTVPLSPVEAFYGALEVIEIVTKVGVRFVWGKLEPVAGNKLILEMELKAASGNGPDDEAMGDIVKVLNGWPFTRNVGRLYLKHNHKVPILDTVSKSELCSVTVAGKDTLGVLQEICDKLHKASCDITAMTLRTQGKLTTKRFASVFYIKRKKQSNGNRGGGMVKEEDAAAALARIKAELEVMEKCGQKLNLEVSYSERVAMPEMWLNWELSRHEDEGMEMPADVSLNFYDVQSPLGKPHMLRMVLICNNNPHIIFDTFCTLHFRGYNIVKGEFKVFKDPEGCEKVKQDYQLELQQPADSQQPRVTMTQTHVDDITNQLSLAFCRRQTEGQGVEVEASDKPGLLHDVAELFHRNWWSITRADVEIVNDRAKTIIYARPGNEMSPAIGHIEQELRKLEAEVQTPSYHPDWRH